MRRLLIQSRFLWYLLLLGWWWPVSSPAQRDPKFRQPTDRLVIPPSPEVAQFTRYGNIPTSFYTGSLQFSLPLATITDGPLQAHVSLSYSSSGNRVEDVASWVGLGWTLNAGGTVAREVHGSADDLYATTGDFKNFLTLSREYTLAQLAYDNNGPNTAANYFWLARGCWDAEPDVFSFNFAGYRGQCSFDWNGNLRVHCDKKVQVTPSYNARREITQWRIVTEDGTSYTFADTETTSNATAVQQDCNAGFNRFTSAWHLTTVQDANAEHQLSFTYESYNISYGVRPSEALRFIWWGLDKGCAAGSYPVQTSAPPLEYSGLRLKQITASHEQTRILLTPGGTRTDTLGLTGPHTHNLRSLARVSTTNAAGTELKAYALSYDPAMATGRLTLSRVQEIGLQGATAPAHRFTYSAVALPRDMRSKAQDHWGYYNGAEHNTTLIPPYVMYPSTLPGGDRSVNAAYATAGLLTRIHYPTGGHTELDYEANEYSAVTTTGTPTHSMVKHHYDVSVACGDPVIPVGSSAFREQEFTILPMPDGAEPPTPRPVVISWSGYNYGATRPQDRPYVKIYRVGESQPAYETTPKFVAHGTRYENVVDRHFLLPGTYRLYAFTGNPLATYEDNSDPVNGGSGCPYAQIGIWYENPAPITSQNKMLAGGARLQEIREYSSPTDPNFSRKKFSYTLPGEEGVSSGVLANTPIYEYNSYFLYWEDEFSGLGLTRCDYLLRLSRSHSTLGLTQGNSVGYRHVSVEQDSPEGKQKTAYRYTSPLEYGDFGSDNVPFAPVYSLSFMTGLLLEQIDYRQVGSQYAVVKRSENSYQQYLTELPGFVVAYPAGLSIWQLQADKYETRQYLIALGHSQLLSTKQTAYDPTTGAASSNEQHLTYNAEGTQLRTERKYLSPSTSEVTTHYYLNNYVAVPAGLETALSRHVLPEIETIVTRQEAGQSSVLHSTYHDWNDLNGKLRPHAQRVLPLTQPLAQTAYRLSAQDPSARPDDRLREALVIDAYDEKGNILQQHRPGDQPTSYIWGYRQTQPIAEIKNASHEQVAFTSFEPESPGGWLYQDASRVPQAIAGSQGYGLGGSATVRRTGLSAGEYELSLWAHGTGIPQVSGASQQQRQEVAVAGDWHQHRYQLTLPANATVEVSTPGYIWIDEVRLHPVGAQMTTSTYEPLVGMSSRSDVNGQPMHYEYDGLGRLKLVRDLRGNIRQQHRYHYKPQ